MCCSRNHRSAPERVRTVRRTRGFPPLTPSSKVDATPNVNFRIGRVHGRPPFLQLLAGQEESDMFALIIQVESLAGGSRYGSWAPPGFLTDPSKGWHSNVESGFTECPSRACQYSGIFAHHGRLDGELPVRPFGAVPFRSYTTSRNISSYFGDLAPRSALSSRAHGQDPPTPSPNSSVADRTQRS